MKPYSFYLNKLYEVGPIEWGKLALTRWHISRRWADTSWKLIVPEFLRGNIVQKIHRGLFGAEKCKLRAKSCVHWLGMYRETENLVISCSACQKYHNSQQKEPMIPSEIPSRPWQTVSADLLNVQQSWFLIVSTTTLSSHFLRSFTTSQPEPSLRRWKNAIRRKWNPRISSMWERYSIYIRWVPPTTHVAMGSLNAKSRRLSRRSWNPERLKTTSI